MSKGTVSNPTSPIVSYRYGNQITQSHLKIFPDGKIEHVEYLQATPTEKHHAKLPAQKLSALKVAIEAAKKGTLKTKEGGPTTFGSSSGDLFVTTASDKKVTIKTIERGNPLGGHDKVKENTSPMASDILKLVTSYSEVDMPAT